MKNKSTLITLLLFLAFTQTSLMAEKLEEIYIVDLARVVSESKIGKSAQIKMRAKTDEAQASIGKAAHELRALEEKLQKQSGVLSANAVEQQKEELIRKQKDFARQGEDKQSELENQNRVYMTAVVKEIRTALDTLGKEKNYPIIMEKDQKLVLYADPKIDITLKVIQKLDSIKNTL